MSTSCSNLYFNVHCLVIFLFYLVGWFCFHIFYCKSQQQQLSQSKEIGKHEDSETMQDDDSRASKLDLNIEVPLTKASGQCDSKREVCRKVSH